MAWLKEVLDGLFAHLFVGQDNILHFGITLEHTDYATE
jgi:hypothetical protein